MLDPKDVEAVAAHLGKRVRVRLRSSAWSRNTADALDGKTGQVTEVRLSGSCLVRFDEPVKPWWPAQPPVLCWHFDADELFLLPEGQ